MIRRNRHRRGSGESGDLSITAFMNLMVILVPFLLITAVFSRMAILELDLPAASSAEQEPAEALELEIVVRADRLEVGDRQSGLLKTLPNGADGYDLEGLAAYLKDEVKARFPDKTDATLLLEPDIDYDTLVQVMDKVRVVTQGNESVDAELFPEISIGDAPMGTLLISQEEIRNVPSGS